MPSPIPRQDRRDCSLVLPHRPRPPRTYGGSAPASFFSRPAQRSLSLQPGCLPSRLERRSTPEASAASLPPLLLRLLPGGANQFPGGTFPLWTSAFHGARKYLNNVVEQDHRTVKETGLAG